MLSGPTQTVCTNQALEYALSHYCARDKQCEPLNTSGGPQMLAKTTYAGVIQ
jgi:hypothetical protein